VVVPVYKNEGTIAALVEALGRLNDRLDGALEVVFVVDGSPDRCYELLQEYLPNCPFSAELVSLSRNFGSFAAVRMGLSVARGPYFAVMAADLQEPPELIEEFFRALSTEQIDITVGTRADRDDPLVTRVSSGLFWRLYRRLVQPDMPEGGIDVFGCNLAVRDALLALDESNSSLVGQVVWLGFRRKCVPYKRLARQVGKSAWTFRRKVRYMFDSIFSFTNLPLTLLLAMGAAGLAFSVVASMVVFLAWLRGGISVPGYTPVILVVLIAMFSQMLGLGVIGVYVWRTFENTKHRPSFIPMLRKSFPKEGIVSEKKGLANP
jgi:glycosyltransferase involved in cell wall biosynthesis